jgi:phage gp29-like protein
MSRNRQNRPKTTPKSTSEGVAFAESGLDLGILGSETTARQLMLAMADLNGLPNPDPILRAEGKSLATYRQMVDGHLSSVMGKRTAAVRARPWTLERGKASARTVARLQETLDHLDVRQITSQFLSALGMGYSVQEVVWQNVGGWIAPERVVMRPPEWFAFGLRGETRFLDDAGRNEIVPPRKLLVARHRDDYLNPYGRPILSECFWPLAFKRGGLRFWMMFAEKFGLPKTIAKVPSAMPQNERTALLISLEQMVRAAAAVIPESGTVSLLETKASGDLPFPELVKWADSEMSKAWLGETLTTELQQGGSRAAAQVHDGVRADLALDDASLVEAGFNQLIQWIWEVNSVTGPAPWFAIQMPQDLKMGRVERDAGLFKIGARFSRAYFEEAYDIAPEHLDRVDPGPTPGAGAGPAFGEQDSGSGETSLREQLLSELKQSLEGTVLQDQAEKLVGPVLQMISKATSFDDVLEALPGMVDSLDTTAMEDLMARVCTLAAGIGLGTDA